MQTLMQLETQPVIDEIIRLGLTEIYFKSGVWNEYELKTDIDYVIRRIKTSGYGADFKTDGSFYYVSIPSDGDMF